MDLRAIFEAWAPQGGPWTPWAKAILFAFAHVDAAANLYLANSGNVVKSSLQRPETVACWRRTSRRRAVQRGVPALA